MERILYVTGLRKGGGIQTYVVNIQRNINHEKYKIDFAVPLREKICTEETFIEEVKQCGSKIYYMPNRRSGMIRAFIQWNRFFKEHKEYRIVHIHSSSLANFIPLCAAYFHHVPIRIVHSHNMKEGGYRINTYIHKLIRKKIRILATVYLADSKNAAEWMFGKYVPTQKVSVIPMGLDMKSIRYDETIRKKLREQAGISDEFVIGNVARFHPQKNHFFLLKIFKKHIEAHPNTKLVLVGDGEEHAKIAQYVEENNLSESVRMVGIQDSKSWMSAFDAFLFPSLYEGFGLVALEAQAAGLPCIVSQAVPEEAIVTDCIKRLPLDMDIWLAEMEVLYGKAENRIFYNKIMSDSVYDVKHAVRLIEDIYSEELEQCRIE